MIMPEVKDGKTTTEWKALLISVATAISMAGGALLSAEILQPGTTLYIVIASLVAVAGVVAGNVHSYIKGRSMVKAAASEAARLDPSRASTPG
jgi:membrane protein DedA with SNARE-associated domain